VGKPKYGGQKAVKIDKCMVHVPGLPPKSTPTWLGTTLSGYQATSYMLDVPHWFPVRQSIQYRVVSLVWRCQFCLAPAYLILSASVGGPGKSIPSLCWERGSGGPVCPYSGYAEPCILRGGPRVWNDLCFPFGV